MTPSESTLPSVHQFTLFGWISRWSPWWLLFAVAAGIGALLLASGIPNPEAGTLVPGLIVAGVALLLLIPPLSGLFTRPLRAEVHPDRLVWSTLGGRAEVPWKEIMAVHRLERIVNGWARQTALTLTLSDGGTVLFDHSLSRWSDLANHVQEKTAQVMLPAKEAELRTGSVAFGPVILTDSGLGLEGTAYNWPDMEYSLSGGYLTVVPAGDQFGWNDRKSVALAEIPNYLVLLDLMARFGKPPVPPSMVVPAKDRGRVPA